MRKMLCFAALCAFALLFAASFESAARAQKDKAKKGAGHALIVVSEGSDGKFRFAVYNADGKFLAMSGGNAFPSEKEAMKGAEEFKAAVGTAKIEVGKAKTKPKAKAKGKPKTTK